MIDTFQNENCFDTIEKIINNNICVNVVLTSPPYNTSRKSNIDKYMQRYESHIDTFNDEEYIANTLNLFNKLDNILCENGVILYNMSYSTEKPMLIWEVIYNIFTKTNFRIVDTLTWKKNRAIPDNRSNNRLTRIVEFVFVFSRENEIKTFQSNKEKIALSSTGIYTYSTFFNFVEAKNNDANNSLNKATYSTELCDKLLNIYAKKYDIIYDPYMGTGTTAISAKKRGCYFIGSEISKKQVKFSRKRLSSFLKENKIYYEEISVNKYFKNSKTIFNTIKEYIPKEIDNLIELNFSKSGAIFNLFHDKNFKIKNYILNDNNKELIEFYKNIKEPNIDSVIENIFGNWNDLNNLSIQLCNIILNNINDKNLNNKILKAINNDKYKTFNDSNIKFADILSSYIISNINNIKLGDNIEYNIKKLLYNNIFKFYYKLIYEKYNTTTDASIKYGLWFFLNDTCFSKQLKTFNNKQSIENKLSYKKRKMFSPDVKTIFNQFRTQLLINSEVDIISSLKENDVIIVVCDTEEECKSKIKLFDSIIGRYIILNIKNLDVYTNIEKAS